MCGQGAGKRKGLSQVEGQGVLGLLGACRTTHNPKIKNKQTKTLASAMKVPSTLKFQQRRCLCSERSCAAQVRSPQSGRSLITLCNIPPNGSSSLLLADSRWTLLGRAHLALTPLLTHIYLLSQNQTCQSLQERRGKSKAIYFSCFSESVIFNMGAVTLRLPRSSLLKGIFFFFCQSSSHIPICWVSSPSRVSSLGSRCHAESRRPHWDPPLLGS